jgi:hypothetical protein
MTRRLFFREERDATLMAIPHVSPTSSDTHGCNRLMRGPFPTLQLLPPGRLRRALEAYFGPEWRSIAPRDLGFSRRTIERWVAGVHNPPRRVLVLLRDWQERRVQEVEALSRQAERERRDRIAAIRESGLWLKGALNRTPSAQLRTRGHN